jgi:outer membrane protein, heavy metal efflux system
MTLRPYHPLCIRCCANYILILLLAPILMPAQTLTLRECEQAFLKNNLLLIAEQFSIESADARILQASLWDNPVLSGEFNAISPDSARVFDVGAAGQKAFGIQQLFYLGGRKVNEVELASTNAAAARLQFQDLLRNLKYQLRSAYFSLYYDRIVLASVTQQLRQLDTLVTEYTEQAAKGNLPYKDVVRLQALYLALQNNRTALNTSIIEQQQRLQTLLATTNELFPAPTQTEIETYQQSFTLSVDSLQALALRNRPDVALASTAIRAAEVNLSLQQSIAVPDVTLGANYDQRGGAFINQVNLTFGIALPFWNRNQGNISVATAELARIKALNSIQILEVRNQVSSVYRKYQEAIQNIRSIRPATEQNFEAVYIGMLQNFQRRNVTILEFTDFIESYTNSITQIAEIRKKLTDACEELNLVTASTIF